MPQKPSIETLIEDIYRTLEQDEKVWDEQHVLEFSGDLARRLSSRLAETTGGGTLRLSNIGTKCLRKLWYSIRHPGLAEPLPGSARLKFILGDIFESVLLFLAKCAGHDVTDEQKEVTLAGIKGHIDGLVDGHLVDLKSASPFSFAKFRNGLHPGNDSFGYLTQLGAYCAALGRNVGSFLVGEKVLGKLHLDTHVFPEKDYEQHIENLRAVIADDATPPRAYSDVESGAAGNRKLGIECSYCPFKRQCWPGLRGFAYARGPEYLTNVVETPRVPEFAL